MKRYVIPRLKVRTRENGVSTYVRMDWRKCKISDFEQMGVTVNEKDKNSYEARLCPDVSQMLKHLYRIKNTYGDQKERISFSVEIEKCENKLDLSYCKRD